MKNFTRAKKIGNEDFQQNGNGLGVSGTIETNVSRNYAGAEKRTEFSLPKIYFLREIQTFNPRKTSSCLVALLAEVSIAKAF